MEHAVPLIFTRDSLPPPMRWVGRAVAAGVAFSCLAVLVTGMLLKPNGPEGISTHTQLGLLPCAFEQRTGLPCPTCGYTTAVSYFAHGNAVASFYVQPAGFAVAVLFAAGAWAGGYVALTGRPVYRLLAELPVRGWLIGVFALVIGGWGWKIWIHLTGRDHWPV